MDDPFLDTLARGAAAVGVPLGDEPLRLFARYHQELLLWNRRINLVSEPSAREVALRHFVDSLTPLPWIARSGGHRLIDLGCGGGFPGIPLRIARPDLQLTLVEASRKKASFLSQVVRVLSLDGVTLLQERVETLSTRATFAGRYDTVISRAAFKLPDLIRKAALFLSPGGRLIALKGPSPEAEMAAAEPVLAPAGMVFEACRHVSLPVINLQRNIIIYSRGSGDVFP
jgi:16S rRNA (guanine527-N7)-methyltransferase